jgi:hypothetical protein
MVKQGQKAYMYRYNQPVPTSGSDVVAHASEKSVFVKFPVSSEADLSDFVIAG